jgi:hypothetical protein
MIQDLAVCDITSNEVHDELMLDVVEKPFDVRVDHPSVSLLAQVKYPLDGLVSIAESSEAVRSIVELGLEDPINESADHLLGDPIPNSRDA